MSLDYNCAAGQARLNEICSNCPPGTYSYGGISQQCTLVPVGTFNPNSTSASYANCEYAVLQGAATCREGQFQCEPGTYFNGDSCQPTPPGYYTPLYNMGIYYACPPGTYSHGYGSSGCITAPIGYYSPFSAATSVSLTCGNTRSAGAINCVTVGSFIAPAKVTTAINSTAGMSTPTGVAIASSADVYITDAGKHNIRRLSPTGGVTVFAGTGVSGFLDGAKTNARFNGPSGLAIDSVGNLYIADTNNNRIRKISSQGVVTTVAGGAAGYLDGQGTSARFRGPVGVTVATDLSLFVTDNQAVIRKISRTGQVTTVAGTLNKTFTDGVGTAAHFNSPFAISIDTSGRVYVVDAGNGRIRSITPDGIVKTFVGHTNPDYVDGAGSYAGLNYPYGLAVDPNVGSLYFGSTGYGIIRRVSSTGVVISLAGAEQQTYAPTYTDGVGTSASFYGPQGVAVDSIGNLYIADTFSKALRKVSLANISCSAGYFFNGKFCTMVPGGYFIPSEDAGIYYACPGGTYSLPGSTACISSPAGNFTPTAGQAWYYPCPNNTYDILGTSECIIFSSPPTSFPTYPVKVIVHGSKFWLAVLIASLIGLLLCCISIFVCWYKCWRDTNEEHHQHLHEHDPDFGVEGPNTIQVHAMTNYVKVRADPTNPQGPGILPQRVARYDPTDRRRLYRGERREHNQVVSINLGHVPGSLVPRPASTYHHADIDEGPNIAMRQVRHQSGHFAPGHGLHLHPTYADGAAPSLIPRPASGYNPLPQAPPPSYRDATNGSNSARRESPRVASPIIARAVAEAAAANGIAPPAPVSIGNYDSWTPSGGGRTVG